MRLKKRSNTLENASINTTLLLTLTQSRLKDSKHSAAKIKTFDLKREPGAELEDMLIMKGSLQIMLGFLTTFCEMNKLPCKITNISHKFSVSKSLTHPQGRAADISVKDWSILQVHDCIEYLESKSDILGIGAYSLSDGKRRVAIHHDAGLGSHIHIQVSKQIPNQLK